MKIARVFEEQNKNRTWQIFAKSCENCTASIGELKVHQKRFALSKVSPNTVLQIINQMQ